MNERQMILADIIEELVNLEFEQLRNPAVKKLYEPDDFQERINLLSLLGSRADFIAYMILPETRAKGTVVSLDEFRLRYLTDNED